MSRRIALFALFLAVCLWGYSKTFKPKTERQGPFFEDVAEKSGIHFHHFNGIRSHLLPEDYGSGVCFADIDGTGWDDLYFVNSHPMNSTLKIPGRSSRNALYRNRGNGMFVNITDTANVAGRGLGMGCLFGDFGNTGREDLLVTTYGKGNIFYRNQGHKRFVEETASAGLGGDLRWGSGACAADYDGDGRLDIDVPHYAAFSHKLRGEKTSAREGFIVPAALNPFSFPPAGNSLYRNEGAVKFKNMTSTLNLANISGRGLQCLFTDFNGSGLPDIYFADDMSPDAFFVNSGHGTFENDTSKVDLGDISGSMGVTAGDLDGQGQPDLLVTQWMTSAPRLYVNTCNHKQGGHRGRIPCLRFSDQSEDAGLDETTFGLVGWGVAFLDYDNDGCLDLLIVNGSTEEDANQQDRVLIPQRMKLFQGHCDGTFTDVSDSAGPAFARPINGRGLAIADYDHDGRMDAAINVNGGRAILLHNIVHNSNHWLELRLRGVKTNRDAVGARVDILLADGRKQTRWVTAGGSYLSENSLLIHFGCGRFSQVELLKIRWPRPSRLVQIFHNVPADRLWDLSEGGFLRISQ